MAVVVVFSVVVGVEPADTIYQNYTSIYIICKCLFAEGTGLLNK